MRQPVVPDSKRIVITGLGVVSPIGIGKNAVWTSLSQGMSGLKAVTLFNTSALHSKQAGQIADFRPEDMLGLPGMKNIDRTTKLALCASKLALEDADFKINEENASDTGVVLGSTNGSVYSVSEFDKKALRDGPYTVNPAFFPNLVMCSAPSQVAIRFGIKGMSSSVSSGFNSGLSALQYAVMMLKRGHVKHILTGSAEELCEQTYRGFYRLQMLSGSKDGDRELSAPLDRERNGFVMGEGAVVFMLETFEVACARKARIYAEITTIQEYDSFVNTTTLKSYLKHINELTQSIAENETTNFNDIDFVSLGVNSSTARDFLEARILNKIFEPRSTLPAASAIKSLIGESYSAGVSFQMLGSIFCMETASIFPTLGLRHVDERCRIEGLIQKTTPRKVKKSLICTADIGLPVGLVTLEKSET